MHTAKMIRYSTRRRLGGLVRSAASAAGAPSRRPWSASSRGGFTLVELLVVIAIIVLILAAVVPSVVAMWGQRKLSETENVLRGALTGARQRALLQGESGLLFALGADGVQRIFPIQRADEPAGSCDDPANALLLRCKYGINNLPDVVRMDLLSSNRFKITGGAVLSLPSPIRVIPRYAVLADPDDADDRFSDNELINNDFGNPDGRVDAAQRHRNFFSVVFSSEGQLVVGRDVFVFDEDAETNQSGEPGHNRGDLTGMSVGKKVEEYQAQDGKRRALYPQPFTPSPDLVHLITVQDSLSPVAANFPSVDGVLVYDDGLYQRSGGAARRRPFLAEHGRPYYVSRVTGDIIRGPLGENADPES